MTERRIHTHKYKLKQDESLQRKTGAKIFCSIFLILALIAPITYSIQGMQSIGVRSHAPQFVPPGPTTPYWSYTNTAGYPLTVAVSKDGGTVVAGFQNGFIRAFGRQSNAPLWSYNAGRDVGAVAVSANGSIIVAGGSDCTIHVFDRQNNKTLWNHNTTNTVLTVAVSDDGSTIVAGGGSHTILVFGTQSNATIWSYKAAGYAAIQSAAVSSDGSTIVAASWDNTIRVFGRSNNRTIWSYYYSSILIPRSVAVSADGNTIVEGGTGSFVRVFSRSSNTTLWVYQAGGVINGVAVSRDGTTIAASGLDGYFEAFARSSNTTILKVNTGGSLENSIALSSDGSAIASGSVNGGNSRAYLGSPTLGLLWAYPVPNDIGTIFWPSTAISGDGSLIAYACLDNKLYVFQYDIVPPVLGAPTVTPSSPVGGQSVTISVSATDNINISAVTLHYWNTTAHAWTSVAMSLTGAVYHASIGPFSSGDFISYYISATDTSGNTATSPSNAPLSYYTFTVGSPSPGGAPVSESLMNVLIGVGLGAVIGIVVSLMVMRGKRGRR